MGVAPRTALEDLLVSHGPHDWILAIAIAAALTACSQQQSESAAPPVPAAAAPAAVAVADEPAASDEARKIFSERCATCHGMNGAGDGPASAGLTPMPRNFQDPDWQKSVSDEHIEQIVQYGGAAVGKSAAMPSNPDLTSRPKVVAALRDYVRNLSK
jgi:mono/diheme cytochrome c family protein